MVQIFYDVETTGTNFRKHSIISLAGIVEVNGVEVERFDYKLQPHPNAEILDEALRVNGITTDDLLLHDDPCEVLTRFKKLLGRYCNKFDNKDKIYLAGFNNRAFDDFFLRKWFELCGDQYFGSWFWTDTRDVLVLASIKLEKERANMPSFKLPRVAKTLGLHVNENRLHEAMYDVELTRDAYKILTV